MSKVHIWLAYVDHTGDRLDSYACLLDAQESRRYARLRSDESRSEFLTTRALVRTVLSRLVPRSPESWRFTTNEVGRLRVEDAPGLSFSLSHSRGAVVCAVSREVPIGVDMERYPIGFDATEIFGLLARDEARALRDLPHEQLESSFLECWTLKEAYLKARGVGFIHGADRVWFPPGERPIRARFAEGWSDDPDRWTFGSLDFAGEYRLGLAVGIHNTRPVEIEAWRSVPLGESPDIPLCEMDRPQILAPAL